MTLAQFLLESLPSGDLVLLDGDEGRHAATVKRARVGEQVLVGDGHGTVLDCTVRRLLRDAVELEVTARRVTPPADPRLVVVQALPKGDRAELAVELLTELGVDEIVPWSATRSIARWDGERGAKAAAKWQRAAREAAKQSRRPWIPEVTRQATTAEVAALLGTAAAGFVLHEDATAGLGTAALPSSGRVVLVVGPEGGVSPEELAAFADAGALAVRLGDPVLRTSTAGGAALAALNLRLGRWA